MILFVQRDVDAVKGLVKCVGAGFEGGGFGNDPAFGITSSRAGADMIAWAQPASEADDPR